MKNWLFIIAAGILSTACAMTARSPANDNEIAANDNLELGMAYLQQANMPQAKEKFRLALQQAPHWPMALDGMAYFLAVTGDNTQAGWYYHQAVQLAPHDGRALNNEGVFLCRHGQPRQAIQRFLQATQDPDYFNSAEAYENAGLCALTLPDNPLAATFFAKALQQDPRRSLARQELIALHGKTDSRSYAADAH